MKKICVLLFAAGAMFSAKAQTNDAVTAYIEQYKQLAMDEMIRTGVPASITLAQGILESSAGQSQLTTESNNHFGIKCKGEWTGDVVYHDDDLKHECFRRYTTAEDSYRDHSDFLKTRPNYAALFDIDVTDYKDWAYGLKSAGYATNPSYAVVLINTIEKYNLEDYTATALLQSNQINIAASPVKAQDDIAFQNTTNIVAQPIKATTTAAVAAPAKKAYPDGVFAINETRVIYAKAGTSLFAVANKFNIAFGKLLGFNELTNGDILKQATLIFLEKKPKRSQNEYHIVQPNESVYDIAQKEGIQLQSLLAYNNFNKDVQLKAGDKILLVKK